MAAERWAPIADVVDRGSVLALVAPPRYGMVAARDSAPN
jgi:hypothetical protein